MGDAGTAVVTIFTLFVLIFWLGGELSYIEERKIVKDGLKQGCIEYYSKDPEEEPDMLRWTEKQCGNEEEKE